MPTGAAKRSVLLLDDDQMLLDALVRVLRQRFVVRTCTSPNYAIELLRKAPDEFFAVVSDVRMPEMDGPEFLTRAYEIAPRAKTILLSGALEAQQLVRVINGPGLFRCLQKPVPTNRLTDTLEDAWRAHMLDAAKRTA